MTIRPRKHKKDPFTSLHKIKANLPHLVDFKFCGTVHCRVATVEKLMCRCKHTWWSSDGHLNAYASTYTYIAIRLNVESKTQTVYSIDAGKIRHGIARMTFKTT